MQRPRFCAPVSWKCRSAQAESPDISLVPAYLRSFAGVSLRRHAMTDQPNDQSKDQSKSEQPTSETGFQYRLSDLRPVSPPEKITLTFPDGARREYAKSIT